MVHSRNFPTSTHYFPDLIKHNAIYVDKTQFIVPLLEKEYNSNFFLSRPRRFGKSLFVSTLEHVFLGEKELFKGLYIYDKIPWEAYPVVLRDLDYLSIMLQTGYLTFKKPLGDDYFIVNYPNKEVENSFNEMLLGGYLHKHPARMAVTVLDIQEAIERHDLEQVIKILTDMFGTLPSHFFEESQEITDAQGNTKTVTKAVGESFYHAIIYLIFNILAIKMDVEIVGKEGRIDAVVQTNNYIYIFEFKKDRTAKAAIQQIIKNNYPQRYALSKKKIYLIGIAFSLQKKGIKDHQITPFPIP